MFKTSQNNKKGPGSGFVGVCLFQQRKVEFKRSIIWGVNLLLVQHFISPWKHLMSEGRWLFTLKMTMQALGNRDFPNSWFQPNLEIGQKNTSSTSTSLSKGQNWKSKTTLFPQTFKLAESKVPLFSYHFLPPGWVFEDFCFWAIFTFGWNHL